MPRDPTIRREGSAYVLKQAQILDAPDEEVFAFFQEPGNLEAITPRRLRFSVVDAPDRLREGATIRYRLHLYGIPLRWVSRITDWDPPRSFTDVQIEGPYASWRHEHRFSPQDGGTLAQDRVRYELPFEPFSRVLHPWTVARDLRSIFRYRARRLALVFGQVDASASRTVSSG